MKKEKNGTLHWLDLNVTQSPWSVIRCPHCGYRIKLRGVCDVSPDNEKCKHGQDDKVKVSWIKGVIEPPEEGKYYIITEAQNDTALYKKGDIVIAFDRYSKTLGWLSFIVDNSTWKILAWAEILLPDVPEEVEDRLVTYFDTEVKK